MFLASRRSASPRILPHADAGLRFALLVCLSGGCGSAPPGGAGTGSTTSAAATATSGGEDPTTTGEEETTGTTSDGTEETTDGTEETSPSSDPSSTGGTTGEATTGEATTGAPIDCVPPPEEGSTSTGDTETGGEPPDPVASWQEYVTAECTALVGCGCDAPSSLGKDLATCTAIREAELGGLAAQGYAWNGECAAMRLAGIADACAAESPACEATQCPLFSGTAGFAEDCEASEGSTPWADGSNCAAEHACSAGQCLPVCGGFVGCGDFLCGPQEGCFATDDSYLYCELDAGPGEHCDESIGYGPECEQGLVCTPDEYTDGTCKVPTGACEPCNWACAAGLYCDWEHDVCRPPGEGGSPCTSHMACKSHACDPNGTCAPSPGEGEPCPNYRCADGLACASGKICRPIVGHGEPCGPLAVCASGLGCSAAGSCHPVVCFEL